MKVQAKHGKVTQNMHGASRNYRYVWDVSPWSKRDYSRHIREASMAMEGLPEVVPPSGRVPGQLLLVAPIFKRRWQRYREEFGNNRSILGVSSAGAKYRRRGATRHPGGQAAC